MGCSYRLNKSAYFRPLYATDVAVNFGFFSCGWCWRIAFTCCWLFCVWRWSYANASLLHVSSTSNFASNFNRFGCDDDADVDGMVDDNTCAATWLAVAAADDAVASLGPALSNWRTLLVAVSSPLVDAFNLILYDQSIIFTRFCFVWRFLFLLVWWIGIGGMESKNNCDRSQHVYFQLQSYLSNL